MTAIAEITFSYGCLFAVFTYQYVVLIIKRVFGGGLYTFQEESKVLPDR